MLVKPEFSDDVHSSLFQCCRCRIARSETRVGSPLSWLPVGLAKGGRIPAGTPPFGSPPAFDWSAYPLIARIPSANANMALAKRISSLYQSAHLNRYNATLRPRGRT